MLQNALICFSRPPSPIWKPPVETLALICSGRRNTRNTMKRKCSWEISKHSGYLPATKPAYNCVPAYSANVLARGNASLTNIHLWRSRWRHIITKTYIKSPQTESIFKTVLYKRKVNTTWVICVMAISLFTETYTKSPQNRIHVQDLSSKANK